MDLRQLGVIRAIAETGSFTAAGDKLHVSQSAISRQVLLLEEELGEAVFYRVGRRVRITPAGKSVRTLVRKMSKYSTARSMRARTAATPNVQSSIRFHFLKGAVEELSTTGGASDELDRSPAGSWSRPSSQAPPYSQAR